MNIIAILTWIKSHYKIVSKAIYLAFAGILITCCIVLSNKNKTLSNSLEIAQNNIEAYLGVLSDSLLANRVLRLDITDLKNLNDSVLLNLAKEMKENKIKSSKVNTIATQKQNVDVIDSRGVRGPILVNIKDSITNRDTTYIDSILYNKDTKVYYWIKKDSVKVRLSLLNKTDLFIYTKREYVNNKSFLKRLFTLDFKRRTSVKYKIINSNELLKSDEVRVIESIK